MKCEHVNNGDKHYVLGLGLGFMHNKAAVESGKVCTADNITPLFPTQPDDHSQFALIFF